MIYGKLNDQFLTELIDDKVSYTVQDEKTNKMVTRKYSQMTDKQKENVVNRIKSKNAEYAKIYVWTSEGHKYYATAEMKAELKKVGITKNIFVETAKQKGFVN